MNIYDLIIIGAGPAGITAAVYAARKKMRLLVVTKDIGGQTALSGDIENYTGYQFISGPELTEKFAEHLRRFEMELKDHEPVTAVRKEARLVKVVTNKASYFSKAAIIASGKRTKELNVQGEQEFKNRGLTYCATCDGPLFTGKDVAVIGGGNSALDAAIQLIKLASHVYLINASPELSGDAIMQEQVEKSKNVTVYNNSQVLSILGDKYVQGIRVKTNAQEQILDVRGVFVEIGLMPNSEFVSDDLEKNKNREIKVDIYNQTNIPGIFAAGDVTDVPEKQIIIAAGEGAKAALGVFRYLVRNKNG
ncbi:MAG: FAD-dependent oxidoreductase [Candidatus Omnitrophota bacterium]